MKPLHWRRAALLVISIATAGMPACSDPSTPRRPVDHDAQGAWREDTGTLAPGFACLFTLTETSGVLIGTGAFSGEAGPVGSLTVTGTVANDSVRLRIIAVVTSTPLAIPPTDTETFAGVLSATDQMDGTLTAGGRVQAVRFVRSTPPSRP